MNCKLVPDFRKELDDCRKSLQKYCYFTTDCEHIITDEEQLNEKYSDVHYYTYTDFVNKNKSMASHFQQLIYRGLYLEPVQWTIG